MASPVPPVDEIVGLLASYAPQELSSLRDRYPEDAELFRSGIIAGKVDGIQLKVRGEIALSGMQVVAAKGAEYLGQLDKRIHFRNRLKLGAQLMTVVASSAVLSLLKSGASPLYQFTGATIGFLSSVFSLMADALSRSKVGHTSIEQAYLKLAKEHINAEGIAEELDYVLRSEQISRIDTLVRKANACSAAVKEVMLTA